MAGHEVYPLAPSDLAAWRSAAEPLRSDWAAAVRRGGYDPDVVLDALKAKLSASAADLKFLPE
jgi:hypothetical protein